MDTRTGEIVSMDFVDKLKKEKPLEARFYKEIPEDTLTELQGMNRHERRKWYALNKHRFQIKEVINE
jgi:hypothetical protein